MKCDSKFKVSFPKINQCRFYSGIHSDFKTKNANNVSVLDAIRIPNESSHCVKSTTVKTCFRQVGFTAGTPDNDDDENISLSKQLEIQNIQEISPQQDIDSYFSVDDDVTISKTSSNKEIVASVSESIYEDRESDDNEDES